jgi:HPt (histidine-containing phosphotransfer) domain-containing protein
MKSAAAAAKGDEFPCQERPCNLSAALERLDGDQGLLTMLITIFREDSVTLFEELQAATESRDIANAKRHAHSLKGLAANFDGFPAVNAALVVEEAARQGDWQAIIAGLPDLKCNLELLRQALADYQQSAA